MLGMRNISPEGGCVAHLYSPLSLPAGTLNARSFDIRTHRLWPLESLHHSWSSDPHRSSSPTAAAVIGISARTLGVPESRAVRQVHQPQRARLRAAPRPAVAAAARSAAQAA